MAYTAQAPKEVFTTGGNAAFDFSRFASTAPQRREYERRGEQEREERRRVAPKTAAAVKTRRKLEIPVFGIVGALVCAVLLLLVINTSRKINEINVQIVETKSGISQMRKEEKLMRAEYDNVVDLREVEEYARAELGMTSPGSDQTVYIDLSGEDTAEVYKDTTSFLARLKSFAAGIFG